MTAGKLRRRWPFSVHVILLSLLLGQWRYLHRTMPLGQFGGIFSTEITMLRYAPLTLRTLSRPEEIADKLE